MYVFRMYRLWLFKYDVVALGFRAEKFDGLKKCHLAFRGVIFFVGNVGIWWWVGEMLGFWVRIGKWEDVVLLWWSGEFSVGWFGDFCGWVWWNDYTFCGGQPVLFWWKITPLPKNITLWSKGYIFSLLHHTEVVKRVSPFGIITSICWSGEVIYVIYPSILIYLIYI